jgi:hypothetical protein
MKNITPKSAGLWPTSQSNHVAVHGQSGRHCHTTFGARPCRRGLASGRRVGRKIADIPHCPQQFGFRQDFLRPRNHVCGRVLAKLGVVMQQGLHFGHALGDPTGQPSSIGLASLVPPAGITGFAELKSASGVVAGRERTISDEGQCLQS